MPWIENISLQACRDGHHFDAGPNSLLIQIVDPFQKWSTPKHTFAETIRLRFADVEEDVAEAIQPPQAKLIALALRDAYRLRRNVVVHCVAGVCRSGGIVEAGIALGFTDTEVHRSPNIRVKTMVMKALGLGGQYA